MRWNGHQCQALTMRTTILKLAFRTANNSHKMSSSILARIALPPHTRNTNLRRILHRIPIRDSSSVKHSLFFFTQPASAQLTYKFTTQFSSIVYTTHLCSGKVMPSGKARRPAIQRSSWRKSLELDVVARRLGVVCRLGAARCLRRHCLNVNFLPVKNISF